MNRIEMLKAARERIASGKSTYICFALDEVVHGCSDADWDKCEELQDWIHKLLGEYHGTYVSWLSDYHPELLEGKSVEEREEIYRQGRIQWIDWMIEKKRKKKKVA